MTLLNDATIVSTGGTTVWGTFSSSGGTLTYWNPIQSNGFGLVDLNRPGILSFISWDAGWAAAFGTFYNGPNIFAIPSGDTISLTHGEATFSLISLQMDSQFSGATSAVFVGTRSSGALVGLSVALDTVQGFQTFTFDSSWVDLESVTFRASTGQNLQFDNILLNSAAVLGGLDNPTFLESDVNATPQIIDADVTLTDPDSADFAGGSLAILDNSGAGGAHLGIRSQGTGTGEIGVSGLDVTYGGVTIGTIASGTGGADFRVNFNANATPAAVEALIESLTFHDPSDTPVASRSYSLTVSDGDGATSATTTFTASVTAVNDAPAITSNGGGASASLSIAENSSAVATVTASDPELASGPMIATGAASPLVSGVHFDTSLDLAAVANGALAAVSSSVLSGYEVFHQSANVNDGAYGNSSAWIPNTASGEWIKIDLGQVRNIGSVALGRDRLGSYDDRDIGRFTISLALSDDVYAGGNADNDASEYTLIFDSATAGFDGIVHGTQTLLASFTATQARYVKVGLVSAVGQQPAIDEIEVFGSLQALTYSISGGADADKFTINPISGALSFLSAPDFEAPTDVGGENVYDVIVQASDGSLADSQSIAVSVTNVSHGSGPPVLVSAIDDVGPVTGTVADGGSTDDAALALSGIGDDSPVYIFDGSALIGTALVSDGVWSFATRALSLGTHQIYLRYSEEPLSPAFNVTIVNAAPSGNVAITGTATEDQVLAADTSGIADADGLGTFSYQWHRDGAAISGATSDTYQLGDADVGASITVSVSYTDGQGTLETLTSDPTGPVTDANDAPTALALANVTGTLAENTSTAAAIKVADIEVADDGLGSYVLGLAGADDDAFEIVGTALYLKAGTVLDFETQASFSVTVTVDDDTIGATPDASQGYTLTLTDVAGVTLTGNGAANTLVGTVEPDTLRGLGGDDILIGGLGDDLLDGGMGGGDRASYADAPGDVVVSLAISGPQKTGGAGFDTLMGVEQLTGSAFGDTLTGDGLANRLAGGAGDDTIEGGAGADLLFGGANDSAGDTLSYASSTKGVTVSLSIQDGVTAQSTMGAGSDILSGFENLTGSAHADTLGGSTGRNVLSGGDGDDRIKAGAGADVVDGGKGNDVLFGGFGADTLTGGDGEDDFIFHTALGGANVDLITDFEGTDRIRLDNAIFTRLMATGPLSADFFHVGTEAADLNDFIIYDDASGALYYDSNGSRARGQVQFATLDPGLALTNASFNVF